MRTLAEVQAFCPHGGEGTCDECVGKLLNERDELREVLRDAAEEHGVTKALAAIEATLRLVRKSLKEAGFAESYGALLRGRAQTPGPVVTAREQLDAALRALSALVRPSLVPPPVAAKLPAEPCRTCSAPAGAVCNEARHGAAWCYHSRCGRLMRGGTCDTCSTSPPMDEAVLVPEHVEPPSNVNNFVWCAACGATLSQVCTCPRREGDVIALGPRLPGTWCGNCGAAPGQPCRFATCAPDGLLL